MTEIAPRKKRTDETPMRPLEVLVLSPTPTWPLDFGNRKRVYETCRRLKDDGHRVTFVHYASEGDWRNHVPIETVQRMASEWDAVHHIAPSRPLHPEPVDGEDHAPDEWWDPSIETFLSWLFARQRFDIFIVGYTWLSRALLLSPKGTLTVLDTTDRFGSRRQMLLSQGIKPEFFHLRDEDEAVCLNRADIVWAIKDEERDYFASICPPERLVITVPYAEQALAVAPRAGLASSVIRLGVLGARNNVNQANIRGFLGAAIRRFASMLAPLKVVLAGGMCADLEDIDHPMLEKLGFLEDIETFYETCDVVVVPMAMSSGQKIRVGEALARGKPVIGFAHAFEGYPSHHHPYHRLQTMDDLVSACLDLAFSPEKIAPLTAATFKANAEQLTKFDSGITRTLDQVIVNQLGVLFIVPAAIADVRSLFWARFEDLLNFARWAGPITCWYDGPVTALVAERLDILARISSLALGRAASEGLQRSGRQLSRAWTATLKAALERSATRAIWSAQADIACHAAEIAGVDRIYCDLLLGDNRADKGRLLDRPGVTIVAGAMEALPVGSAASRASATLIMPMLYRNVPPAVDRIWSQADNSILLLSSERTGSLLEAVAPFILKILDPSLRLICVHGATSEGSPPRIRCETLDQQEYLTDWARIRGRPLAAIILDGASADTSVLDEFVRRYRVPCLRPDFASAAASPLVNGTVLRPVTVKQLYQGIVELVEGVGAGGDLSAWVSEYENDYSRDLGWSVLWRELVDRRHAREFSRLAVADKLAF